MEACNRFKSLIIDVAGGAAGEGDRLSLNEHMSTCEGCTAEFTRLTSILEMTRQPHADPGEAYWSSYYGRLMEHVDSNSVPVQAHELAGGEVWKRLSGILMVPKWTLQLAVAVVLVVSGVLMGRSMFTPSIDEVVIAGLRNATVEEAALEERAHTYLNRSKTLLLGLVNFDLEEDDPATLNFERRQAMAGELVREASFLQDELSTSKQRQLRELISDLEIILLQISNIESAYDVPEIEIMQSGMDRKAILFKIDVEEMRRLDVASSERRIAPANSAI